MAEIDDVGEQTRFLLETYRKPNGEKYAFTEIEKGTNNQLKYMWLWKLAHSQIKDPKRELLYALTDFLGVKREFWTARLDEWRKQIEDKESRASRSLQNMQIMTARYLELSPEQQEVVLDVIESLAKRSKGTRG